MKNRISVVESGGTESLLQIIRTTLGDAVCDGEYVMKHFLDWFEGRGPNAAILKVAMVGEALVVECTCLAHGYETVIFFYDRKGAEGSRGFSVIPGNSLFK